MSDNLKIIDQIFTFKYFMQTDLIKIHHHTSQNVFGCCRHDKVKEYVDSSIQVYLVSIILSYWSLLLYSLL